jgi:hypothetical protein
VHPKIIHNIFKAQSNSMMLRLAFITPLLTTCFLAICITAQGADNPAETSPAAETPSQAETPPQVEETAKPPETPPLWQSAVEHGVQEIVFALRQAGKDQHWYANFGYYADSEDHLPYGDGGKLCRLNLATKAVTIILEDKQGSIRDPVVDYDAQKILFSYRKGGERFLHLYEIQLDGSGLRQLTDGPYDDLEPCYLPNGKIVFVSTRCNRWVSCWFTKVANLHTCNADGSNIRQISANIEHDNTPWPLPDGRILYQRWEYVDRSQVNYHHLWTANPDGTSETIYFGNQHPGTVMLDAKPIPNTQKVVAIFSPMHGLPDHNGTIEIVDIQEGPDAWTTARPLLLGSDYRDPWAFSEKLFMAAKVNRLMLIDDNGKTEEIYRISDEEAAAKLECHEPRPIVRRQREPIIPERINSQNTTGTLVLMNVYQGRNMDGVKRGEIKKLLVLETLPKPINFSGGMEPITMGGSFNLERVLGTVPVEPDGSANIELPAMRSVFFVALDENDMAVKRMQSFTSVQPGETRGCIGCHEQRTRTVSLHGNTMALQRKPSRIEPIADCPDVFDFPRDIQPILDKLCCDCHGFEKTERGGPFAGNVLLADGRENWYSDSYITLTTHTLFSDNRNKARSNYPPRELGSSASRILKMLDGSHHDVRADEHEFKMLRLWIDTGATYAGTYGSLGVVYSHNTPIVNQEFLDVVERRCESCHINPWKARAARVKDNSQQSENAEEESPNSEPPKMQRPLAFALKWNLMQPDRSPLLMAPLSKAAGGMGLCRDESNADANASDVFVDKNDPDYLKLLASFTTAKQELDRNKRFDMPGFRPHPAYIREMKHYGILMPSASEDNQPIDCYALDRRYWESLWYRLTVAQPADADAAESTAAESTTSSSPSGDKPAPVAPKPSDPKPPVPNPIDPKPGDPMPVAPKPDVPPPSTPLVPEPVRPGPTPPIPARPEPMRPDASQTKAS